MIEDIDVLRELELKNKEIYLNKLDIDLDNNDSSLMMTIENIHNVFNQEIINKITEILSSTFNKDNISIAITKINVILKQELIKLLNNKKKNLKEDIKNIDDIEYREKIDSETALIINNLKMVYQKNVIDLINEINNEDNNDKKRIEEYLNHLNYDKYIKKIKETIENMDNILFNNYRESLEKYHNLNEKTLKL